MEINSIYLKPKDRANTFAHIFFLSERLIVSTIKNHSAVR